VEVGAPERLFQTSWTGFMPYGVLPDGSLIANVPMQGARVEPIVVMLNWQSLLDR